MSLPIDAISTYAGSQYIDMKEQMGIVSPGKAGKGGICESGRSEKGDDDKKGFARKRDTLKLLRQRGHGTKKKRGSVTPLSTNGK